MAELIYRGMVYRDNAPLRLEGDTVFVPTDDPLPVGTRLQVRQGSDDGEYVVTHVRERGEAGMELKRVEGDAPKQTVHDAPTIKPTGNEGRTPKKNRN